MGTFDWVNVPVEIACPKCEKALTGGWQTKDTDCLMVKVELDEVDTFYTSCRECGEWVQYHRKQITKTPLDGFELSRNHPLSRRLRRKD